MKPLSKRERWSLYKRALKYMQENEDAGKPGHFQKIPCSRPAGLCGILAEELHYKFTSAGESLGFLRGLVELQSFKPERFNNLELWFASREERMEVLRKCIKMSKPSIWERIRCFLPKK